MLTQGKLGRMLNVAGRERPLSHSFPLMIDERYILSRLPNRVSIFAGQVLAGFYSYLGTKLLVKFVQITVPRRKIDRYCIFINYCEHSVSMRHFVSRYCL
jgi:hypothetical protein